MPSQIARGLYHPTRPMFWVLRSKMQDQCKPKPYANKPTKYNAELFDLVPVYEVQPDD